MGTSNTSGASISLARKAGRLVRIISLAAMVAAIFPAVAPAVQAQGNCQTFAETRQNVCGRFLDYWKTNGGLAQQGYPLTGEMDETNAADDKIYKTQYFERAVFELHPENEAPYDVLLILLGNFEYRRRYATDGP